MKVACLVLVLGLFSPALALGQAKDLELTVYGGYNLGGGIDVREDVSSKYKLDTSESFSTGLSLTWQRNPAQAFELLWSWRPTDIEGIDRSNNQRRKVISLNEHDFHANFLFMPAYREGKAVPFLLLGLGATYLNPGEAVGAEGGAYPGRLFSPDGATKFSWALGAGVKTFMNERFGLRAQVRYHSTYVSDESGETWCDPWYGCYTTVDTNWLDEWDFTGGIVVKMGK
jgi:opacity protein-like surface antigen